MTDNPNDNRIDSGVNMTKPLKVISVSAPKGVFDHYYRTAFAPEDIRLQIEKQSASDPEGAGLREELFRYRFYSRTEARQEIVSDRFLAFWVELMYREKTVGKSRLRLKLALRSLKGMLENKKLDAVFGGKPPDARVMYEQLYGAARRYFLTCQTDRTYSSQMFGFGAIKRPQLIEKIVADFFDAALCFAWSCGLLREYPFVGQAAFNAWADEFPGTEEFVWQRVEKTLGFEALAEIIEVLS